MLRHPNNPKSPPTRKEHDCIDYIAWAEPTFNPEETPDERKNYDFEPFLLCTICGKAWHEIKQPKGKLLNKSEWNKFLKEPEN